VSRLDLELELEPKAAAGRRIEVIRGGGGRRRWSNEKKARAIDASLVPGAVVSEVGRLHGVTPQQLFTWRRQARCQSETSMDAPPFVPAIVESSDGDGKSAPRAAASEPPTLRLHAIELDVDGTSVWIWRDAEPSMVTAIIGVFEGPQVIGPTGAVRVMVATRPVDFRKGAEGMAGLVREVMQADPFDGAIYLPRRAQQATFCVSFSPGDNHVPLASAVRAAFPGLAEPGGKDLTCIYTDERPDLAALDLEPRDPSAFPAAPKMKG